MKKINLLMIALMAISMAFFACKKDDDKDTPGGGGGGGEEETFYVIDAVNVQGANSNIVTVKASVLVNDVSKSIASADFSNGSFKLSLPNKIDGVTEPYLEIFGYDNEGTEIGVFTCFPNNSEQFAICNYYYSPTDNYYSHRSSLKIDDFTRILITECAYKKGWNAVYTYYEVDEVNKTFSFTTTTTKPSVINFIWSFTSN
jgi:hypothetical protein